MNPNIARFHDIHAHASAVRDWRQTYSQISAGSLQSSLKQLTTSRSHLFREQINQRVVQHGEAPVGKVCFAVPIAAPGAVRMQGCEADDNSIFFLRGGEEFMFHMPIGMDMLSITFDDSLLDDALEGQACASDVLALLRQPVVSVPARRLAECRRRLLAMFTEALVNADLGDAAVLDQELEQAMLAELVSVLSDPDCDRRQRHASSTHGFIVEKCHRLTMAGTFNAPSVLELCERLQISRRTAQNSFRSVAETTPVHYLRSVRLNGVRRDLMSTRASDQSIGDIASTWGFFHLSHFAADYHELFGELPSQTMRAAPTRPLNS